MALLLIAGLGGLTWNLTHRSAEQSEGRPAGSGRGGAGGRFPTTVGVAKAGLGEVPMVIESLGTVTPTASVTVRPQVSGVLQQVLFKEGQMVRQGQLLAIIDPRPFEMALMQASGQRQRDEAQLENARLTLERYRGLLAQDSIARQEVDTQAAQVKQLEGTVVADKAAEGAARLNLGYSRIVAPTSGRVGLRVVDVGNVVNTGDTEGVAVITQLSPIDVEFTVPQDQVGEVQQALSAGGKPLAAALDRTRTRTLATGTFLALDNRVDTQTGTVRAKARFANEQAALFPNQFVNLRLQLGTVKDAVLVPVNAVRHGTEGDYVYVLNRPARTVSVRAVQRGRASVDTVAIAVGLKAGEEVITEGGDRLSDGAKVALPEDRPRAAVASREGGRAASQAGRGRHGGASEARP